MISGRAVVREGISRRGIGRAWAVRLEPARSATRRLHLGIERTHVAAHEVALGDGGTRRRCRRCVAQARELTRARVSTSTDPAARGSPRHEGAGLTGSTSRFGRRPSARLRQWTWATDHLLARIAIDPNVCFGKPTVRGTRIWVGLILGLLADGMSVDDILREYPQLSGEDIRACLAYGARLSVGHFVDVA